MVDEFVCQLKTVEPMATWVKGGDDGKDCRPCTLGVVAGWYASELDEQGQAEQATAIREAFEGGEALTICKQLDHAKAVVGEQTRAKLLGFDCEVQSYRQDEAD